MLIANDDSFDSVNSTSTVPKTVSCYTQTENSPESENGCDNSSDELKDEYPLAITLDDDITSISKIVPVSSQDAWVISNTNLQKIRGLVLEQDIFVKSVNDIAVLDDGSVLVLSKGSNIIMKLIPNKRLIRFVSVSLAPYCLCKTVNKCVLIALCNPVPTLGGVNDDESIFTDNIVQINQDGIKTHAINFVRLGNMYPFSMDTFDHDDGHVYMLYHHKRRNKNASIFKVNKNNRLEEKEFNGICGMEPAKDFQCYGILCDSNRILVSDNINQKIYALDKDLKFNKCIIDASLSLESPKAIALSNKLLWISDQSKIFIFKHDLY